MARKNQKQVAEQTQRQVEQQELNQPQDQLLTGEQSAQAIEQALEQVGDENTSGDDTSVREPAEVGDEN